MAENLAEAGKLASDLLTASTDDFGSVTRDIKGFHLSGTFFFRAAAEQDAVGVRLGNLPGADGDLRCKEIRRAARSTSDIQPFIREE